MGQGREQARQFLKENPEVAKEVRERVLAQKFPPPTPETKPGEAKSAKSDAKHETKPEKSERPAAKSAK